MLFSAFLAEGGGHSGGEYAWLVWVALVIFVLMVFLGWLVSSKGWLKPEEEVVTGGHGHDAHGHAEHAQTAVAHAASVAADDLKIIEGIGPKVQQLLNQHGIHTFAQLAAADVAQVKSWLEAAGYGYMDPGSWPQQADLAAKGDSEGLQKLQDSLKGGRTAA